MSCKYLKKILIKYLTTKAIKVLFKSIKNIIPLIQILLIFISSLFFSSSLCSFTIMAYCWALLPAERPSFLQLHACLSEFYAQITRYV